MGDLNLVMRGEDTRHWIKFNCSSFTQNCAVNTRTEEIVTAPADCSTIIVEGGGGGAHFVLGSNNLAFHGPLSEEGELRPGEGRNWVNYYPGSHWAGEGWGV